MTPEDQQIEIEKACGWTFVPSCDIQTEHGQKAVPESWCHEEGRIVWDKSELPDYLHDLNAMREAVLCQPRHIKIFFSINLRKVVSQYFVTWESLSIHEQNYHAENAAPSHRAKALLLTLEKWEGE